MPVLAVPVADVVVRDLHPAVALGLGDHALDETAVLLLDVGPAAKLVLSLADPHQERVANALELGGAEQAGPADRADVPVDALTREGGHPKLAELLLQARDLAAKLVADGPLVLGREWTRGQADAVPTRRQGVKPGPLVLQCFSHTSKSRSAFLRV